MIVDPLKLTLRGSAKSLKEAKVIIVTDIHNDVVSKLAQQTTTQGIINALQSEGIQKSNILLRKEGFEKDTRVSSYEGIGCQVNGLESQSRHSLQTLQLNSKKLENEMSQSYSFETVKVKAEKDFESIYTTRNKNIAKLLQNDIKSGKTILVHIGANHLRAPGKHLHQFLSKTPHLIYSSNGFSENISQKKFVKSQYLMLRAKYLASQGRLDESTVLVDQAYKLNPTIDTAFNKILLLKHQDPLKMYQEIVDVRKNLSDQFYPFEKFYIESLIDLEKKIDQLIEIASKATPKKKAAYLKQLKELEPYRVTKSKASRLIRRLKKVLPDTQHSELSTSAKDISQTWPKRAKLIQQGLSRLKVKDEL